MSAEKTATHETQLSPTARKFLEENTMRDIFGIPEEALDAVMATAYQLYQAGRFLEVEVLCRGLIAADHRYWWSYSLYAATLRRLGRLQDAVEQLERGLVYEPDEPKLLLMRSELRAEIAGLERGASGNGDVAINEANNNDSHAAA
jgi:predicted Zn-dependent protease